MPRSPNALDVLRRDHKKVLTLFHRFEKTDDESEQRELCDEIVNELKTHAEIEEEVFYPYLREATAREDLFEEATLEHETTKDLLAKLQEEQPGTPRFHAMVKVLGEYVAHHVKEEESEIFPQVEKTGVDLEALGLELEDRRAGGPGVDGNAMSAEAGEEVETEAVSADAEGEDDSEAVEAASEDTGLDTTEEDEQYIAEHAGELSRSTERAKWIHSLEDQPDRDGQTLATRNPEVIRHWAQERRARPATTANGDPKRPRVLRFDFPDYDKGLQEISWDAWLRTFEERHLVFVFQERMKAGNQSNFFILDSPEREDG
ncbi:hemerythrin domain-containing protein [Caldimonas brevitalea]|uniref:Regulator of cell morphogenesis and NO signaling n=1 Tax=Caldimonas brevitalea TaxID=413882 RepID=A0A0G3BXQ3_9BURK|nr:hemerythrin domain-containing protein [Caldimonas brevitalea]AKJ32176.1 regulator of cell morphogenesis and NO signaling [Caldimonas brevitalea]